jgi:hypothetical protein
LCEEPYTILQLGNNTYDDWLPQINGSGQVVWRGSGGPDDDIFRAILDDTDDGVRGSVDLCPTEDVTGFSVDDEGGIDGAVGLEETISGLVEDDLVPNQLQKALLAHLSAAERSVTKDKLCTAVRQPRSLHHQVDGRRTTTSSPPRPLMRSPLRRQRARVSSQSAAGRRGLLSEGRWVLPAEASTLSPETRGLSSKPNRRG